MPFTPTHVAAILPVAAIARRALPFSALVIGSMIPDLPLFVPLPPDYGTTHSVPGVFTACLPLGMVGFLIFQGLLKRPLWALLPDAIRGRCASLSASCIEPTFTFFASASLAIVIGATTHLFWDSFTHQGRWGTSVFPRLSQGVLTTWGHEVPGYKVLQYGSTLLGLPCVVLLLVLWLSRQRPSPLGGSPALPRSWRVASYVISVAIPVSVTLLIWARDHGTPYAKVGQSITISGLSLGIFLLAYCTAFHAILGGPSRPGRVGSQPTDYAGGWLGRVDGQDEEARPCPGERS
jgi:hypothetical protein